LQMSRGPIFWGLVASGGRRIYLFGSMVFIFESVDRRSVATECSKVTVRRFYDT
jgi:hypothetical protein